MQGPVNELRYATREIEFRQKELAIIGSAHQQDQQLKWLLVTGTVALLLGLFASPFLARLLPFGLDGRVAATIMATGSLARWRRLDGGGQLRSQTRSRGSGCAPAAKPGRTGGLPCGRGENQERPTLYNQRAGAVIVRDSVGGAISERYSLGGTATFFGLGASNPGLDRL